MSERENSYVRGFFTGVILGGVVGAITALLLAPKSGRELRADIRRRSGELYWKARELFEHATEEAADELNTAKERARSIVQSAREQAEAIIKDAERALQEARGRAASTVERLRQASKASIEAFKSEVPQSSPSEDQPQPSAEQPNQ